jgi:Protein of unknown function (DUF402)
MSEPSRDEAVSDSGGTMRRLTEPPTDAVPDLAMLETERRRAYDAPVRPAADPPYLESGDIVTWHYGHSADVLRVVRDDARGLVAWLPSGSEQLASEPVSGGSLRDLSLAERFAAPRRFVVRRWRGPGIIRVAPTGVPWSIWYFFDDDGRFEGHYVNLELTHERPIDGSPRVHTRDLILDLWLGNGETWLKDDDELAAAAAAGRYTPEQIAVVRAVADQARRDQIDPRAWPLDEGWESWRPPAEWDEPLTLPASVLEAVSKSGEPVRRVGETRDT